MYSKEEAKTIRLEFWNSFQKYSASKRRQKGLPKKWMLEKTGIKALNLKFEVDRNAAFSGIVISTQNEAKRMALYEKIESIKTILSEQLTDEVFYDLVFLEDDGRETSRIYCLLQNVNIYQQNDWPEIHEFLFRTMIVFEETFLEFRDFIADITLPEDV